MDQLFALFDTYRWLGSAFGVMVLTAIVRYLATRMLNQARLRAERTDNSWDDAILEAMKKPLGFGVWAACGLTGFAGVFLTRKTSATTRITASVNRILVSKNRSLRPEAVAGKIPVILCC